MTLPYVIMSCNCISVLILLITSMPTVSSLPFRHGMRRHFFPQNHFFPRLNRPTPPSMSSTSESLTIGFYQSSCPSAETIVSTTVQRAISTNPGIGAGLIRLFFHDCFVRGCDASVLLSTPGSPSERDHPANNPSLRGFEVIDEAKSQIEAQCPNTVSCADILAFAARDSSYQLGRIQYAVAAGRRDGDVSNANEVDPNLPNFFWNTSLLAQNFAQKGFSVDEMVTLSGAHSIGIARCASFIHRLYQFNTTHDVDPSLDPKYAAFLKTKCPTATTKVPFDLVTPNTLDNMYYKELLRNRGLLASDQTLMSHAITQKMVLNNARDAETWANKFAKAMVHMGSLDVLTGTQGQIRTNCNAVN